MRKVFAIDFPLQPTHITLYTRDVGIGLADCDDVQKLTRLLTPQETGAAMNAIRVK
jgi:hypothetical protein